MKIVEQRILRGANLYGDQPCLLTLLDLETLAGRTVASLPGFAERLQAPMAMLASRAAAIEQPTTRVWSPEPAMDLAQVIERLSIALQCSAGSTVAFSTSCPAGDRPGMFRIVCAYRLEKLAQHAFETALRMVEALARGEHIEMSVELAALADTAERYSIGTSTAAILEAAQRRGIPFVRLTEEANLFQLGWDSKQKRLQATITGDTGHVAVDIASDKQLTKALLGQANIPVPRGGVVRNAEEAIKLANQLRGIVTLKPLDANHGRGVTTQCVNAEQVAEAYELARRHSRHVIVERFLEGRDYRVLVTGNRVAAAACRKPPTVVGDGVNTVKQLVQIENSNPKRGAGHTNILTKISLDEHAQSILAQQGYDLTSVPPAGVEVILRDNANISSGGTAEDVTDTLPPETVELCLRAARTIGLDIAGIDVICRDISQPLRKQHGGIIEVNAAPGIRMHQYPSRGTPRDAGGAIVEAMFGEDDGRIPTVAVTGTNGKTTTSLLIAHAVKLAGLRTGVTTTEGIFINGLRTMKGDCTGYWSARSVLSAPDVDFAVLETARGGILKRGLGFDRCDVGVVLNVSEDHLGLDGIDTIDDLAHVKGVIARAASRAVVLNAEDRRCVAMRADLKPGVEVIYFSMDPEHPALLGHLHSNGRAVYLQDDELVIADGQMRHGLLRVETMPVTIHGHARYNIANALAAAAALMGAGFSNADIFAGLSSFVSNGVTNPLRSNLYRLHGVNIIVDYAHNPAACEALSTMARSYSTGKIVAVVTAPGDRKANALREIGRTCGTGFDELIVYESDPRGRPGGETSRLLLAGAAAALPEERMHAITAAEDALRFALKRCQAGDTLVFSCADSVSQLVDAVRAEDPEGAMRIAVEGGVA